MECGLSSIPTTQNRDRPTDLRQIHHTRKGKERQQQLVKPLAEVQKSFCHGLHGFSLKNK